jgi:hypothetical protein
MAKRGRRAKLIVEVGKEQSALAPITENVIPNVRSAAQKRAFKLVMFVFYMSRQLDNNNAFTFYVSYQGAKCCSMVFLMSPSLLNVISLSGRLKRGVFLELFH